MVRVREGGRRAKAFVAGTYGGAPVDYLMAIAGVYALMVVTVIHNIIRTF